LAERKQIAAQPVGYTSEQFVDSPHRSEQSG